MLKATTFLRAQGGSSLVEFALVLPLLALLLVGVVDFGRYVYDGILAAGAARAGAQYGAQSLITADDSNGMQSAALADAGGLPGLSSTPSNFCSSNGSTSTCYVEVTATGTWQPLIRYPFLPAQVTVSGSDVERVEAQ